MRMATIVFLTSAPEIIHRLPGIPQTTTSFVAMAHQMIVKSEFFKHVYVWYG